MSTDTTYVCNNKDCDANTQASQPGNCPKCGKPLEGQKDLELEPE